MNTRARIATVARCRRSFDTVAATRDYVLRLLDLAIAQQPDLVCLPETFIGPSSTAEPVPGPTTDAAAQRARDAGCYVVCPIFTRRDGHIYNSAVILDRKGQVAGIYDKLHPVTQGPSYADFEQGVTPGAEARVFELDFGSVGIQICFDAGFPESWQQLADQGARLILWPSAYNGGYPLQTYAALHHVYVASAVGGDRARIIDPCGNIVALSDAVNNVIWRDINLDHIVCHHDFNYAIPDRIMARYGSRVAVRSDPDAGVFLVEPLDPAVTIDQLQTEFGFESYAAYHERHRQAYAALKAGSLRPQQAPHGQRPQWNKD